MGIGIYTKAEREAQGSELCGFRVHPAASAFPLIDGPDFAALVDDIKRNGLVESIWAIAHSEDEEGQPIDPDEWRINPCFEHGHADCSGCHERLGADEVDLILDGRNRLRACVEAGVTPRFRRYEGADPVGFVVSLNIQRRHLDESQRGMIAARLATLGRGKPSNVPIGTLNRVKAAELMNVAERTVARGRAVLDRGVPELVEAVDRGEVAISRAAEISKLPAEEQRKELEHKDSTYGANRIARFVEENAPEVADLVVEGKIPIKVAARIAKEPDQAKRAAMITQLDTGARSDDAGDSWGTPPDWIDLARKTMGDIDLDPASNNEAQQVVNAKRFFTKHTNGLEQKWAGRVWMNPPYSQPLVTQFAEKLVAEIQAGNVTEACVLVNNATDARFLQHMLAHCSAALFPRGRIPFLVPGSGESLTGTRQGQAFVYFGENTDRFVALAKSRGWVGVSA